MMPELLKFDNFLLKIRSLTMERIFSSILNVKLAFQKSLADLGEKEYFQSGMDFSKILIELAGGPEADIGEGPMNLSIGNKTEAAAEMIAGVFYGVLQKNHLEEIQLCMQDGDEFVVDISKGIHMMEKMDFVDLINGASLLASTVAEIPAYLHQCESIGPDVKLFEQWLATFEHPKELIKTMEANLQDHLIGLTMDLA